MPRAVTRLLDAIETAILWLSMAALAAMLVLGAMAVFFRFVVQSSLSYPEEAMLYLFVWVVALGAAVAFRHNMHAAIGTLVGRLPDRARQAVAVLSTLLSMSFMLVVIIWGTKFALRVSPKISPALEISNGWLFGAAPVGAAVMFLFAIELCWRQATDVEFTREAGGE